MHKYRYLKIVSLIQALLGLILAAMSFVLVPVCPPMHGMHMSCFYTGILVTCSGIIILILAALNYFLQKDGWNKLIALVQIIIAALAYMIPSKIIPVAIGTNMQGHTRFIGLCMKPMPCWNSFRASSICLLLIVIIALVYLAMQYVMKKD